MPTRRANSVDPVRVGPLHIDGVMPVEVDLNTHWLQGESLSDVSVDNVPTELDVGDGVSVASTPAGNVTPPGPSHVSGVAKFYLFKQSGETLVHGKDYTVTLNYHTPTRADAVTVIFTAVNR